MQLNPLQLDSMRALPSQGKKGNTPHSSTMKSSDVSHREHRNWTHAATSMNRAMRNSDRLEPVSSIHRIGQGSSHVSTSIAHPDTGDLRHADDGRDQDAILDQLRYSHIRQSIRERKATEATAAQASRQTSKFNTRIDTGSPGFLRTGPKGIERHLYRMVRTQRATLKNISKADQKKFLDIVDPHVRQAHVGHGFGRVARKQMIKNLRKEYMSGSISKADFKDMKKMVQELPKRKGFFGS